MTWKPIIAESKKKNATNILDELARVLVLNKDKAEIIGLLSGKTGIALFLYYYSRFCMNKKYYSEVGNLIASVFDAINSGFNRSALGGGISGIAWCIKHLETVGFINKNEITSFSSINDFFVKALSYHCEKENFDFIYGSTGIVNNLLDWKGDNSKVLTKYVDALEFHGESENGFIKWKSIISKDKQNYGYNLSLSHGNTAIALMLSKILNSKYRSKKVERILKQSVNYILSKKQDTKSYISNFPNIITAKNKYGNSRMAWCYGDLGIGIALYQIARIIKDKKLEIESLEILKHTTKRRNLQENRVFDAGLCHGTAGIAHIYNRMYNYTGDEIFKESVLYWVDETLKMAMLSDGLVGYKAWTTKKNSGWVNGLGLLEGISGVGLMMISAISDIEPAWDSCLLLS
ncbi:MAG: lanthionine synthetase C family protein [Acidobacteriota bacterium]